MSNPIPPHEQIRMNWNRMTIDPIAKAEADEDIANGWDPLAMMGPDDLPKPPAQDSWEMTPEEQRAWEQATGAP